MYYGKISFVVTYFSKHMLKAVVLISMDITIYITYALGCCYIYVCNIII